MSVEKAQMQEQIAKYGSRVAKQLQAISQRDSGNENSELAKYCSDTAKYISGAIRKQGDSYRDDMHVSISRIIKSIPVEIFEDDQERTTYEKNVRQIIIANRGLE